MTTSFNLTPLRLKRNPDFRPCVVADGDDYFANGIFEFNITGLTDFLAASDRLASEFVSFNELPKYDSERLNKVVVAAGDLSRPIVLAEISPGPIQSH